MTNENQIELFPTEGNTATSDSTEEVLINDRTEPTSTEETPIESTTRNITTCSRK